MAPLSEPLVSEPSPAPARAAVPRRTLFVALLALTVTALILLAVPSSFRPLALYAGQLPDTDTTGDDRHWLQCVLNTGGTCNMWPCHADRGPTECRWFIFGYHCMCTQGYCSGLNGKCGSNPNRVVAASIRLRNVQWPDYYMYLGGDGQIRVTVDSTDEGTKWNLLELPVAQEPRMQYRHFMLGSVEYPSFVATTQQFEHCDTCEDRHGHSQDCNCMPYWKAYGRRVMSMDTDFPIRFTPAVWEEPAVMITSMHWPSLTWMVGSLSWDVDVVMGDPGPQGYWILDPPLNFSALL